MSFDLMSFDLMSLLLLWTSADSLIAAFALSFIVPGRHVLPLALMFGLCDGLGSALSVSMPLAGGLAGSSGASVGDVGDSGECIVVNCRRSGAVCCPDGLYEPD